MFKHGNNPFPESPEEQLRQAQALHRAGRLAEAETRYRLFLKSHPHHFDALHMLAILEYQRGNKERSVRLLAKALKVNPRSFEAYNNRGNVLRELGQDEEALADYRQAVELNPGFAAGHYNQAITLRKLTRLAEALAAYDRALAIKPDYAEALNNRGVLLMDMQRLDEALASLQGALALRPNFAEAINNQGLVLRELRRYEEALASYQRALAINPAMVEAYANRGIVLYDLGRYREAIADHQRALALRPDYADAHFNEALCRLMMGGYRTGWEKYEWRWMRKDLSKGAYAFKQALWLGKQDIRGKTLLLHSEQGLGDTIQFCRYAKLVAQQGARVLLEVQPALKPLLSRLEGPLQVLSEGEPRPLFDMHCPLMSLPLALQSVTERIPDEIPYLTASEEKARAWRERLGHAAGPRIGVVWSGSSGHKNDANRSMHLADIMPLAGPGRTLVSLHKEWRSGDREALASAGIMEFSAQLEDFSDTAALIDCLDLVISVDTAVAHLAGALGKPLWLLLPYSPDWRWLTDRADSPWYPTARLFRQSAIGDWASVVRSVDAALAAL